MQKCAFSFFYLLIYKELQRIKCQSQEGFGKLYIGNDIIESLEPGIVIVAPLNVEHYIENESRNEMVWCFCFNPPVKIGKHAISDK